MVTKNEAKSIARTFLIELFLYGVFVAGYFFLVLHFLGDWLYHLFHDDRITYAAVALVLIICQGIVLESLTRALLWFIKPVKSKMK